MFCPNCGSDDRSRSQFCRACGTDLRVVRQGLEHPDDLTASAANAREEIGRAVAARIKELYDADDLKRVAEDVLPKIEKFLESPHERRLRQMREGVITSSIGLGAALFFYLMNIAKGSPIFLVALGVTCFLLGLGMILNGMFLTVPGQQAPDRSLDVSKLGDLSLNDSIGHALPTSRHTSSGVPSVTENTTNLLPNEPALVSKTRFTAEMSEKES